MRPTLLLSVREPYAHAIFNALKRAEYRLSRPSVYPGDAALVYVPSPVRAILGSITIDDILTDSPDALWARTAHLAGASRSAFDEYFRARAAGYALLISDARRWTRPLHYHTIVNAVPGFRPPQSFVYLRPDRPRDAALIARIAQHAGP